MTLGRPPKPAVERFWAMVNVTESCWLWTGALKPHNGYAQFCIGNKVYRQAHRWAYEYFVGKIPEGLQLDHLCRVRHCVNPEHLEPVTPAENVARSERYRPTECPKGHPYDELNTYVYAASGYKHCRTCDRERKFSKRQALVADVTVSKSWGK